MLRLKIWQYLLQREPQNSFIYDQEADKYSELSTFYRRKSAEKNLNIKPREVEVRKTTLSKYCIDNRIAKINFLKIDTEGSEMDVLTGAGGSA